MVDVTCEANNARRKIKSFIKLIVIGKDEEPSQIVSVCEHPENGEKFYCSRAIAHIHVQLIRVVIHA